jgi:hypothetical protein
MPTTPCPFLYFLVLSRFVKQEHKPKEEYEGRRRRRNKKRMNLKERIK